jgi:chitin synthase
VFLSQRRRWTLGATSNDLLLFTARHCQWWERIVAFSNVLTWMLNVFVIASIGCMIVAFMHQPIWIIMCFVGVMLIPISYYIFMAVWLPRSIKERAQYLAGLSLFVFCGPFLNITVMVFAVFNMDSFGWGKTRKVIEDNESEKNAGGSSDPENELSGEQPRGTSDRIAGPAPAAGRGGVLQKPEHYDEEATRDALVTNGMKSVRTPSRV